jgi:hypothetical protein
LVPFQEQDAHSDPAHNAEPAHSETMVTEEAG